MAVALNRGYLPTQPGQVKGETNKKTSLREGLKKEKIVENSTKGWGSVPDFPLRKINKKNWA